MDQRKLARLKEELAAMWQWEQVPAQSDPIGPEARRLRRSEIVRELELSGEGLLAGERYVLGLGEDQDGAGPAVPFTQTPEYAALSKRQVTINTQTARRSLAVERCTLAHDLNNDLAIIIGDCDFLERLIAPGTEASARLRAIKTTAQRMADRIATRPCPIKEIVAGM